MTNLIAAEWYKLRHSRLLLVVVAVFAAINVFIVLGDVLSQPATAVYDGDGGAAGGTTAPPPETRPLTLGSMAALKLGGDNYLLLELTLLGFIALFSVADFQHGTLRNTVALGRDRAWVYLSCLFSAMAGGLVLAVTGTIVPLVGYGLANGLGGGSLGAIAGDLARPFAWLVPLVAMTAAIFTLRGFACRNPAVTVWGVGFRMAA